MNITSCSVKVMRSYDYCHFEVSLSADAETGDLTAGEPIIDSDVDELRKTAAKLADRAVAQYSRRKRALEKVADYDTARLKRVVDEIKTKPEVEWTPEDKAAVKELGDIQHEASLADDYGY